MVNYQLSKIYKIVCNITGKIYIGSTTKKYLAERLAQHVYDHKNNGTKSSSEIIKG